MFCHFSFIPLFWDLLCNICWLCIILPREFARLFSPFKLGFSAHQSDPILVGTCFTKVEYFVLILCRSVGVLTYVMLTGCSPFAGDTAQETYLNISQVNLDFPDDLFGGISKEAINFMESLLLKNPQLVVGFMLFVIENGLSNSCLKHIRV